jgi:hypothetical protein
MASSPVTGRRRIPAGVIPRSYANYRRIFACLWLAKKKARRCLAEPNVLNFSVFTEIYGPFYHAAIEMSRRIDVLTPGWTD